MLEFQTVVDDSIGPKAISDGNAQLPGMHQCLQSHSGGSPRLAVVS